MSERQRPYPWEVPCGHEREMRGGGVGRREACVDTHSVFWSCTGFVTDPEKAKTLVRLVEAATFMDFTCLEWPEETVWDEDDADPAPRCGECPPCRLLEPLATLTKDDA